MRVSSALERPRLSGVGLLLALAGLVGGALWVLLPGLERLLAVPGQGPEVDGVALAYLRAALADQPEDAELRLRLARGQLRLAREEEAHATLAPLLALEGAAGREARLLRFEVDVARWRRAPRPEEALVLSTALEGFLREPLTPEAGHLLWAVALELGRPGLSAAAAEVLAEVESGRRVDWLREAGRQWLASGDTARAASAWALGAEAASGEAEGVALAERVLEAARGMTDAAAAVRLAERMLERFPGQGALLEGAVVLALSHGALAEANRWSSAHAAGLPGDEGAWRRRREVALAAGDLRGALEACRRLVRLRPEQDAEWESLARVAGWAGAPETELEAWHRLAVREGAPGPVARAVSLSLGLRDMRGLAEVLEARARRATLSDEELALGMEAYERLGEPERAEALLLAERARGGAWLRRLAGLQERQGRLTAALETWEKLEAEATESEALEESLRAQAELLWRLGRPREALARLRAGRERVAPEALAYWRLLATLAWSLDADREALLAYRKVRDLAPEDVLASRRLARLLADSGRVAEREGRWAEARAAYVEALAVDGREPPARLGLLRVLARLEDRPGLAARLAQWREEAREAPVYFEPYARAFQWLGRREEAAEWLGRWASARPEESGAHVEHARALEASGEREAARRAWGNALARLGPEVDAALERLPEPAAVDTVLWAVRLAERQGEARESWASALRSRAGGAAAVQDWALELALARDDGKEVRHWLSRMREGGRQPPAWVLLRVGQEDGDAESVRALLEERGAELALPDRIAAERWLGRGARAWALLTTEPRTGLSSAQLGALEVHTRALDERYGSRMRLSASTERLGGLALSHFEAEGRTAGPGGSQLRARAAHVLLDDEGPGGLTPETVLTLGATLGPERRTTDVELSLTRSASGAWPSALVRQQAALSPRIRLGVDAAWGEPADETERVRLLGLRHRLGGTLTLGLFAGGELSTTLDARWYQTREWERVGEGASGALRLEWPWQVAGLDARAHLSGGAARRWLPPESTELVGSLPERSSHVGAGLFVGRRAWPGGISWGVDAWGGWLWPEGRPGYHLRVGAGLPLPSAGELKLRLSFGNALQGGVAGASGSAALAWEYRFGARKKGSPQ